MKWFLFFVFTIWVPSESKIYSFQTKLQSLFSKTIASIPRTDLYSGVFYKLTMLRYPKGVVSLTNQSDSNGGLLLQIDYDPDNRPLYAESGNRSFEDQWILNPTGDDNYFTLQKRGLSTKTNSANVMAWNSETAEEGGMQVVSYPNAEKREFLKENGKWKDQALWKVVKVAKDQYKIVNKGMSSGVFTSTDKENGDYSYYMALDFDFKSMKKYKLGGEWYKDALFTFTRVLTEEEMADVMLDKLDKY